MLKNLFWAPKPVYRAPNRPGYVTGKGPWMLKIASLIFYRNIKYFTEQQI